MFFGMNVEAFDPEGALGERGLIIRRDGSDVEMVMLPWGLRPPAGGVRPFTLIRAEGTLFFKLPLPRAGLRAASPHQR
jgi:hypothetical protein